MPAYAKRDQPLRAVDRVRRAAVEAASVAVGEQRMTVFQLSERESALGRSVEEVRDACRARSTSGSRLDAESIMRDGQWLAAQQRDLDQLHASLVSAQHRLEELGEVLQEELTRRAAIDRLRERLAQEHARQQANRAQRAADEWASQAYARGAARNRSEEVANGD